MQKIIIRTNALHFLNTCFNEVNKNLLESIVIIINRLNFKNKELWKVEQVVKKYLNTWKKTFYNLEHRKFMYDYFKKFVSLMVG